MKKYWNYLIAACLCIGGFCVYYLNPYPKGSPVAGIVLQLFCAILVFGNAAENETTVAQFRNNAKQESEKNGFWLIGSLFAAGGAAAIFLSGVKYSAVRFGLLAIMWAGLFLAANYFAYFLWRNRNKETARGLAEEGVAQRKEEREKAKQKKETAKESAREAKEREEALAQDVKQVEDAFNNQIANTAKTRCRIQRSPDLQILSQLANGNEAGLQEALRNPSAFSLAAIEEAIIQRSDNHDPIFYRPGGQTVTSQSDASEAQIVLLYLARNHRLLHNPAFSQFLITRCNGPFGGQQLLQQMARCGSQTLFAYQLLGVHLQVSVLVYES